MTWTEDRATQECDPSADPGAKTEGRAASTHGAARLPFGIGTKALNSRGTMPRRSGQEAPSLIANANQPRFQFTLNQDRFADLAKPKPHTKSS